MTLEDDLKKLIIEKYGSVRQFALQIDVPYTTIDTILRRGIDNSNVSNIIRMCKKLEISVDKLLDKKEIVNWIDYNEEENEISENVFMIPVYGTIKAGIPIESQEDIIDYIDIPKSWIKGGKRFYGLRISGDSMFPKYQENDIVVFEQTYDTAVYHGKDVAIMINGTESTFKKLLINENGIVLQPYNASYDIMMFSKEDVEQLPIKVVGVAREKRTKVNED